MGVDQMEVDQMGMNLKKQFEISKGWKTEKKH